MEACRACGRRIEQAFRFCPWCAAPQRLKLVEFFDPHEAIESDRGKALRVSQYLDGREEDQHVRFSVWNEDGVAEAAVSIPAAEATRLIRFLQPFAPRAGRLAARLAHARSELSDLLAGARRA